MGKIKEYLGKMGLWGVGTVIVGGAAEAVRQLLPLTGYTISQTAARGLFWAAVAFGGLGIALIVTALIRHERRKPSQPMQPVAYDHKEYVERIITDSKADALLALPDALRAVGQLDGELEFETSRAKKPKSHLIRIQNILNRLQEDLEIQRLNWEWSDQEIWDAVNNTRNELNLSGTEVNKETVGFMYHVAGVMDSEGMGISARREGSKEYKLVIRLQASISTQLLNRAVTAYLSYSLGINSILLLFDSCPAQQIGRLKKLFGKTDTELRRERKDTLDMLVATIHNLVEKELRGAS